MQAQAVQDPHSYGNTRDVVSTHLNLNIALDFDRQLIEGTCEVTLNWRQPTAQTVDLDMGELTIHSITDTAGQALPFDIGPPHPYMGRRLRIQAPDRPEKLRIAYQTPPGAGALQWLTPAQTTSKARPFLFTQSQAILARTWIPCMDSPGVRMTFDAVVRAPVGLTVVMGADHLEHSPADGMFRFTMPHAVPSYLIALAAGELAFDEISDRAGVYAEPGVVAKAAWECADMDNMIQAAESLYGPYRWGRWDAIILPPSFPYGGMENPMLTFATPTILAGDRSLVSLMAHELAHSWSGNLVTNATWGDFWLNEGCTTYFERRIVETLYGTDIAEMQWLLGQRALHHTVERFLRTEPEFTKLGMNLDTHDPDDAFSELPYEKGANFLRVLETHVGRSAFDTFLQQYFEDNAFQSMTTTRFLDRLQTNLLASDTTAWDTLKINQWVHVDGVPDNMIVPASDHFDRTRAAASQFVTDNSLDAIHTENWVTAEWLDFINSLPARISHEQLQQLDEQFNFTESGNLEIRFAWLKVCIQREYKPAFPAVETFLISQGRRKFLTPLYEALWAKPHTQALAASIYRKARPGYHPIAVSTIDDLITL